MIYVVDRERFKKNNNTSAWSFIMHVYSTVQKLMWNKWLNFIILFFFLQDIIMSVIDQRYKNY